MIINLGNGMSILIYIHYFSERRNQHETEDDFVPADHSYAYAGVRLSACYGRRERS